MEKEVAGLAGCGSSMPERTAVDIRVEIKGSVGPRLRLNCDLAYFVLPACENTCAEWKRPPEDANLELGLGWRPVL